MWHVLLYAFKNFILVRSPQALPNSQGGGEGTIKKLKHSAWKAFKQVSYL